VAIVAIEGEPLKNSEAVISDLERPGQL